MEQIEFNKENVSEKSYEQMLLEIERLLDADQEKVQEFISLRIEELKKRSVPKDIGAMSNRWVEGFIHPESVIRRSYMVDPLRIDDNDIYETLLNSIREIKNMEGWSEKPIRALIPTALQHALAKYFGNLVSDPDTENNNRAFYMDHTDAESPDISLKELKEKNIAVCAEKASTAQNLITFLALKSFLVNSNTSKLLPEGKEELHAYNILETTNGYFVYDPTNPQVATEKRSGKIVTYTPALYPITKEQFDTLKDGGTVSVQHKDFEYDDQGNPIDSKVTERIYGGPSQQ
jgi:hypothetical protein